ncbi:RNA polymerase sigma factor [Candidatus Latescibacterota bacterium]
MEAQADIGLIAACQQGDARAFRRVFEIYRDRVFALCCHMAGNSDDAEDLTQEIFIQAFRNVGSFRAESAFGTWLYRIAANRCLAESRKRRPRFRSVEEMAQQNVVPLAKGRNPEEQLVHKELLKRVEEAVAALPESQRLMFVLGTQMGMKYRDIGQIADCSEDAVKVRIHRARKRVRDALKPYLES